MIIIMTTIIKVFLLRHSFVQSELEKKLVSFKTVFTFAPELHGRSDVWASVLQMKNH